MNADNATETTQAAKAGQIVKPEAGALSAPSAELVETDAGTARINWHHAARPRLVLALGHGAGGGVHARDLAGLAAALPSHGVSVALVEQPWRVAGKKVAPAPATLDRGWRGAWPSLRRPGLPVVAAGRSAGARVACRLATELDAAAVLALAFPLHPPGRPERSRAAELLGTEVPTLVVQGSRDPFGTPEEFPEGAYTLTRIPDADHAFAVPKRSGRTEQDTVTLITEAVRDWLHPLLAEA
ncbi:alpha/beta family hydrolase [Streptomyces sp. NPDC056500]|uniref:alpha/beta hydrolase family protein n=1 Tax=Streptomyces sp. NPDC056500 TaxID=3345840 RepID=UPI003683B816